MSQSIPGVVEGACLQRVPITEAQDPVLIAAGVFFGVRVIPATGNIEGSVFYTADVVGEVINRLAEKGGISAEDAESLKGALASLDMPSNVGVVIENFVGAHADGSRNERGLRFEAHTADDCDLAADGIPHGVLVYAQGEESEIAYSDRFTGQLQIWDGLRPLVQRGELTVGQMATILQDTVEAGLPLHSDVPAFSGPSGLVEVIGLDIPPELAALLMGRGGRERREPNFFERIFGARG